MNRKGIILAGGAGTRLHPSTIAVSKQLMPVFDKPMIYYPLSVLISAGIREVVLITTPLYLDSFERLLGDGSQFGMTIEYVIQPRPDGLAQALIIAEDFLDGAPSALILGDNLFFGKTFDNAVQAANEVKDGANVFGYYVKDPTQYGVVGFDDNKRVISLEEKPKNPTSNYAVTGLYFYDNRASDFAKRVKPSERGELEITDLNRIYLEDGNLTVTLLPETTTWLDTGSHRSLLQAAQFVSVIEERQGRRICCPEINAYKNGWISADELRERGEALKKSGYGAYLIHVADHGD